ALLRYNPATKESLVINVPNSYGLAIDTNGFIWNAAYYEQQVYKIDSQGNIVGAFSTGGAGSGGLAVTPFDNNVWIANRESNTVTRLDNNGNLLATIPVGGTPTGVAVDSLGKVWVTNLGSDNVMRIDPFTNTVDLTVYLGETADPYNYSDMTGSILNTVTSPGGRWSVIQNSQRVNQEWENIVWNTEAEGSIPQGTDIIVRAKTANNLSDLQIASWTIFNNGDDLNLVGQFIEVEVTLTRESGLTEISPILSDLRLGVLSPNLGNQLPEINSTPSTNTRSGYNYTYQVIAEDQNGDRLTYTLNNAPTGMAIDNRGLITWTPTEAQIGVNAVTILVTDGRGTPVSQSFNINVFDLITNTAPSINSTPNLSTFINRIYEYKAIANDNEGDKITWTLTEAPIGIIFNSETNTIRWQPSENQVGNNRVVLEASDGKGGIDTQEFIVNVKTGNSPPKIISTPDTYAGLDRTYKYEIIATDSDNDTLRYQLINSPQGMTINENTGLIEYNPSQLGIQTIDILVSDGFGGFNSQSYQIQVLEKYPNRSPQINTTPIKVVSNGDLYQYDVEANDPENTAINYNLTVKPNGMTIDANTGLITWQTQNTTNGDFQVTVTATDADGGIAYQNYYIRVTPNQAPIISSQPLELAQLGVTYKYDVIAKDADNDTLTYNLLQAPQGLTIDQFGRIRWQSSSQNQGIYPVKIQVSDGRGGITTQTYNLTLSNDDITNPVVELGFNTNLIKIGESINFQVRATDNIEVKTLTLTADKTPLTLNPNTPNGQINTATFVGQKAGVYQIIATATDAAGNQDTETIEVRVLDPSDTEAPVVEINKTNLEATQGIIKSPTDIIATVTDDNLEFYRVEIAPIEAVNLSNIGEDDPDYTLLTKSTKNVINQQVATLDPRLLVNGSYLVKITAFDFSGNGNVQGVILNVTGQNKPGEFSLEYTDLSIPLTGVPIEIIRRYNSLESATQGDFGYGWDLGLQDAKIVESSPDGRDLSEANSDLFGTSNTFSVGTRVTLNTPDGRRVGFTFNPVPVSASFFGAIYAPSFTPDAGVFDKLETENSPLTIRSDGTVGAFLFSFLGYNPSQYKLTTKDGTVYNYDQNFGLIDVTDRNGNKLTFSDEGITSSTGAEIDFIRDGQGRITEIIDPDGKSIKYVYDSNGDLIEVIDRTNNTTELVYDDPNRQHFLTEIIDPLGRSATRTEYDENGQISKIIDANGNELNIAFNNATNSQTIRDPFGNNITRVFDAQGNVIQEVDQLGGITLRTYDEDNNLLSETDPEGNITSYTYDNRGNKLTETNGEGNTKTFTYNDNNDILTETTALGFVTTYTYDNNGNLTKRKDTEGNVTEYKYDSLGLLTTVTDANGKISNFKYDNRGNLTELTDPTGAKTTFTYDSNGRVASVTDALGAITNYIYDAQGRLIEKADPEGSSCGCARGITKTEYNAAGEKIAEIDALGRRTEYRYNDRGLLIETILPDSTPTNLSDNPRTKNEYDALDRLTGFTDELGRKTIYVYDALGREIEVIYPDSTPNNLTDNPRTKKEYDKAGRVIAKIDELGNRTEYDYDKSDRLLTVTNALNQITSYNYDADGRKVAMTDALCRIIKYNYDELDRLLTTTYANNAVMTTTYDPLGRVIAEKDLAGNTTNYEYDALGRLTAVIDALNKRTEYKYDLVGNLIEQKDANGNITKFEYDSLRRLKATILPGGQRNETIHDKIGNLI
ncbi:MAG: putative Ig domain-containing protein, partial [Microcystis aeruginosa]